MDNMYVYTHIYNILNYKHFKGEPLSKSFLISPTVHIRESSHISIYMRWGGKMDRQGRNELECYMT